ncbi:hypothetical protein DSL72_006304 [Monilinia vaccinii-corymbosi]|uniref:Uncharacterized protein n=1 Tax=Monilinia vaccinii-corymbosi TaxID=61207 RepID=A0A8A3PLW1_9HELO|nr:hypothetical protein DSL72_006304 [Monilinia vaccinii-corymbosi]
MLSHRNGTPCIPSPGPPLRQAIEEAAAERQRDAKDMHEARHAIAEYREGRGDREHLLDIAHDGHGEGAGLLGRDEAGPVEEECDGAVGEEEEEAVGWRGGGGGGGAWEACPRPRPRPRQGGAGRGNLLDEELVDLPVHVAPRGGLDAGERRDVLDDG